MTNTKINKSRRTFVEQTTAGLALAGVGLGTVAFAADDKKKSSKAADAYSGATATKPRVLIIGGGAGGATVARYVAKDAKGAVEVTLVEPSRTYYSCFFSNLFLGDFRSYDSLGHNYGTLASQYGVNVVHDYAIGVDRDKKMVMLANGMRLWYDKLVLSPGIDFIEGSVEGWGLAKQSLMPHAYKGGTQVQLLKRQIATMREGGVFCMVAPPNPYRCPPGPYERVSMVAHMLKKTNPKAKILIADPKPSFSKQTLFEQGWSKYYPGMIERIGPDFGGNEVKVSPDYMKISIGEEKMKVDVCNVIPAQRAGTIAQVAGVTDQSGWAPVEPTAMRSKIDKNVHVLGDACSQGDMPKSGFSANSQAKVCANAIVAELTKSRQYPARFNNTCWSLIAPNDGVKVGASYAPKDDKIAKVSGFVSQLEETAAQRKAAYQESVDWYASITADMFGS